MKSMSGVVGVYHFDQMVNDTIREHGLLWSYRYYVVKGELKAWEFFLFAGIPGGLTEQVWD